MPKLWSETLDDHRRAIRDAALDATAGLVAEHGLASVTMSQIAKDAGIGRATLYKYFPDVEAILIAWHERQIRPVLVFSLNHQKVREIDSGCPEFHPHGPRRERGARQSLQFETLRRTEFGADHGSID